MEDNYQTTRRRALKAAGSIGIAGLAGCADSSSTDTTPQPTEEETGYEVIGYEVEDNLDDLEDGEELEVTAKRVLENSDGDKKTEELETSGYQVKGETIRYHEQVEDSILKEAGLHKDLQNTIEQTDNSYSFSANDLIAGKNLLTLQIEINDEEYGNQEKYQDTGEIQISKDKEETLKDVLVEDHEFFDTVNEELRDTRYRNEQYEQLVEEIREEVNRDEIDDIEDLLFEQAYKWFRGASQIEGMQPSGQSDQLAITLEALNENMLASGLSNDGHNTVLAINEETNVIYGVETTGGGNATPPKELRSTKEEPEETPLIQPETRMGSAKATVRGFAWLNNEHRIEKQDISDSLAKSFMHSLADSENVEEIVDSAKIMGATTELSPTLDYEFDGTVQNTEITAES